MKLDPRRDFDTFFDALVVLDDKRREEALLSSVTLGDIAAAWCRVTARSTYENEDDPDVWAISVIDWIVAESHVRELLTLLVELAPGDDVLEVVGAGPLEYFVKQGEAGEDRIRWVESEAERSERFRFALSNVWISDVPAQTFLRVQRAADMD